MYELTLKLSGRELEQLRTLIEGGNVHQHGSLILALHAQAPFLLNGTTPNRSNDHVDSHTQAS